MIDFHSHILPAMDDGSKNIEESLQMLQFEAEQGTEKIILTPHFYATKDSISDFLIKREKSFQELMSACNAANVKLPKMFLGAEVKFFDKMSNAELLPSLCIKGTNVMLLEMPFCQWDKDVLNEVTKIITKQKITIIIAHIERYYPYQKDKKIWDEVFELPVYAQINTGSFLPKKIDQIKRRQLCFKFLKQGYEVVLGSDCHNRESRKPNLLDGRQVIDKKLGLEYLNQIDQLGEEILK